jgi:hypothetical protein
MPGAGIIPVALYKKKLYFLFGKENKMDDSPGYADFGGGQKGKETYFQTAIRESTEEFNGFYGFEKDVKKYVTKNLVHSIQFKSYKSYIYLTEYDDKLPDYFNNNFEFLAEKLPHLIKNTKNGLLEKEQIKWFTITDIKKNKKQFRSFYQNLIEILLDDINIIKKNIKNKRLNKTKKHSTIKHNKTKHTKTKKIK